VLGAVHVQEFGDEPRYALRPAAVRAIAEQFARAQGFSGFSSGGYRAVVFPATRWDDDNVRLAAKYFVERRDIAFVADAFRRDAPLHTWIVRFFKPLAREELQVSVDPESGRVIAFHHVLPEDQPGADLPADAARRIAADFLTSRGIDPERLDLKETTSDKKKARRDHTLVWEARPGDPRNLDDAHFRIRVEVAGDRVASLHTFWKLPETFERARSQRNALSNVLLVLRIVALACLLVLGIWLLLDGTRRRALPWGLAMRIALPLAGISLAATAVLFPLFFSNYDTAFPLQSFEVVLLTGLVIAALGLFVALACGAALILALRPDALAVFRRADRRRLSLDAVFAAATCGCVCSRARPPAMAPDRPLSSASATLGHRPDVLRDGRRRPPRSRRGVPERAVLARASGVDRVRRPIPRTLAGSRSSGGAGGRRGLRAFRRTQWRRIVAVLRHYAGLAGGRRAVRQVFRSRKLPRLPAHRLDARAAGEGRRPVGATGRRAAPARRAADRAAARDAAVGGSAGSQSPQANYNGGSRNPD
jgi:hypothetical protein